MSFIFAVFFLFSAEAADFPDCENIFGPVEEMVNAPSVDHEAVKKLLFKTANDKRVEVLRFVRQEKETYRKGRESELTAFDVETKKNKGASSEARAMRRKEREILSRKISDEKKNFNKDLDTKDKTCQAVLAAKRTSYLERLRDIKRAPKQTKRDAVEIPELNEFNEIPKGPGEVLKPQ